RARGRRRGRGGVGAPCARGPPIRPSSREDLLVREPLPAPRRPEAVEERPGPLEARVEAFASHGAQPASVPHAVALDPDAGLASSDLRRERRRGALDLARVQGVDEERAAPSESPRSTIHPRGCWCRAYARRVLDHNDLLRVAPKAQPANARNCRRATASCARSLTPSTMSPRWNRCRRATVSAFASRNLSTASSGGASPAPAITRSLI